MLVYALRQVERDKEPGIGVRSTLIGSALIGIYATHDLAMVALRTRSLQWCNIHTDYKREGETPNSETLMAGSLWCRFTVCGYDVIGAI